MKKKLTITLDDYNAQLFDNAVRIVCLLRGDEESESSHRCFLLRWIVGAVCSAIIRNGEMPQQLAVELRHETAEEMRQRLAKELPDGPQDGDCFIPPPNSWN